MLIASGDFRLDVIKGAERVKTADTVLAVRFGALDAGCEDKLDSSALSPLACFGKFSLLSINMG